jgi:hypothetical protein
MATIANTRFAITDKRNIIIAPERPAQHQRYACLSHDVESRQMIAWQKDFSHTLEMTCSVHERLAAFFFASASGRKKEGQNGRQHRS